MKKLLLSLTLIVPFFLSGCGSKADEEKTTEIKEIEEKLKAKA